jgi:hypothetical protein
MDARDHGSAKSRVSRPSSHVFWTAAGAGQPDVSATQKRLEAGLPYDTGRVLDGGWPFREHEQAIISAAIVKPQRSEHYSSSGSSACVRVAG